MKAIYTLLISGSVFLSACERAPDCEVVDEHADPVIANAGCMVSVGPALLVVKQRVSGRWNIPSGTSDGESAQCTAHRETWEETGLTVQVGRLLQVFENDFRLYECHLPDPNLDLTEALHSPIQGWLEVSEVRWIRPEDIEKHDWRYSKQLPIIQQLFKEL